jgi:hypothetical protein
MQLEYSPYPAAGVSDHALTSHFPSSISILQYCGLHDREIGVTISKDMTRDSSVLHSVQTGSGADPAAYPMCTGGFFPGTKAAGV